MGISSSLILLRFLAALESSLAVSMILENQTVGKHFVISVSYRMLTNRRSELFSVFPVPHSPATAESLFSVTVTNCQHFFMPSRERSVIGEWQAALDDSEDSGEMG